MTKTRNKMKRFAGSAKDISSRENERRRSEEEEKEETI